MMLNDIELLNFLRQNVQMGVDGIKIVLDDIENKEFYDCLQDQLTEYGEIYNKADMLLDELGGEKENVAAAAKIAAHLSGKMKAITGSASKIAESMIEGTTMGVTKIIKHLNDFSGDVRVKELAQRLLTTEERNIETLKRFL